MKRLIILWLAFGFIHQSTYAQDWNFRYGLKLGLSAPSYHLSNIKTGTSREASRTYGFSLTGTIEAARNNYFAVQSGLSFQMLGSQLDYSEFGSTPVTQRTFWLQLPVNFIAKLPLRDSSNFFLSAGPYGAIGFFGANSFASNYQGSREDFHFGSNASQNRFDYGLNLSIGYHLKRGYSIAAGYMMGLADLSTNSRYEQRNRAWSITFGYTF
jgi:hypothetical protein